MFSNEQRAFLETLGDLLGANAVCLIDVEDDQLGLQVIARADETLVDATIVACILIGGENHVNLGFENIMTKGRVVCFREY